jgi:hypothetical protein
LIIKNCREVFAKDDFCVHSTSVELIGFKWHLEAKMKEKGYLELNLNAKPPKRYIGNYRIEVDWSVIQIE